MKMLLLMLAVNVSPAGSANAQLFTPESVTGAGVGAIAGAMIRAVIWTLTTFLTICDKA